MTDRNWEAELAKIDKQLASISDEQLLAPKSGAPAASASKGGAGLTRSPAMDARMGTQGVAAPASARAANSSSAAGGTWRGWVKVTLAVAAAAGLMYWPWPARCGPPLLGFTAATGGVALLGLWSAVGTWRHRLGLAHVASLLVIVWGMLLGAREVLPRVGYAVPTAARAAGWSCDGLAPAPSPTTAPTTVPNSPPTGVPSVTAPAPGVTPSTSGPTATTAPGQG
jgi:hypothetical protein